MMRDTSKAAILGICTGLMGVYFVSSLRWTLLAAFIIGLIGLFFPFGSRAIEWIWIRLAGFLGAITSRVLLFIVYVIFLFPVSLLFRIFTKDPLMLSRRYNSFFLKKETGIDKKSFEKMW
jgi:hypothetical protein